MKWWHHLVTGQDNSTISIGRVLGLIAFVLFIIAIPVASMVTTFKQWVPASEWGVLFDKFTVYVPAVLLAIAGLIGGTSFAEPKARPFPSRDGENA